MDSLPNSTDRYAVSNGGAKIFYSASPGIHSDRWLIFLHGLGGDLTTWNPERKGLRDFGYSTLSIDLRGHGLSDRPRYEGAYQLENFVEDVIAVLKQDQQNFLERRT